MTAIAATQPHDAGNDAVPTLAVGGPHDELVDALRRAAWLHTSAEPPVRSRLSTWLRQVTSSR